MSVESDIEDIKNSINEIKSALNSFDILVENLEDKLNKHIEDFEAFGPTKLGQAMVVAGYNLHELDPGMIQNLIDQSSERAAKLTEIRETESWKEEQKER